MEAALRIRDIFPLTNGSGFGSGSDPTIFVSEIQDGNWQKKKKILPILF
jgi:hypothetical protein